MKYIKEIQFECSETDLKFKRILDIKNNIDKIDNSNWKDIIKLIKNYIGSHPKNDENMIFMQNMNNFISAFFDLDYLK